MNHEVLTMLHEVAVRSGWLVATSYGSAGFCASARREASGGKLGPATPHDGGVMFVDQSLERAMRRLFRAILPRQEVRSEYDAAHDGIRIRVESATG